MVEADDPETAVSQIIEMVSSRIPPRFGLDPIREVQVLCPMNRSGVGARSLNIELQAALNPAGDQKVERFGCTFAAGDKVMQTIIDFDKDVFNGDIGFSKRLTRTRAIWSSPSMAVWSITSSVSSISSSLPMR